MSSRFMPDLINPDFDSIELSDYNVSTDPVTLEYLGEKKIEHKESILHSVTTILREKDRSGVYMLIVIFLFFFGFNALVTFYSLYATDYLGWEEGNAGLALSLAPAFMVLTAVFTGKLAEKIGRKKTIFIGLSGLVCCFAILIVIQTFKKFFEYFLLYPHFNHFSLYPTRYDQ